MAKPVIGQLLGFGPFRKSSRTLCWKQGLGMLAMITWTQALVRNKIVHRCCPSQEQEGVVDFVHEVLAVWNEQMLAGEAPGTVHMTHMWESLRVFPKPLLVHVVSEIAAYLLHLRLRLWGFKHHTHQVASLWPCFADCAWHGIACHIVQHQDRLQALHIILDLFHCSKTKGPDQRLPSKSLAGATLSPSWLQNI